jgi:Coenzyme PQQ synthesis protein D (PqqD)
VSEAGRSLLQARTSVPEHVLFQEIQEHAALLNLESELYFGLDDVGTRMWKALLEAETVGAAAAALAGLYETDPEQIQNDLIDLVLELKKYGLLEIVS